MKNQINSKFKKAYIFGDIIGSIIAWFLFWYYRKTIIEKVSIDFSDQNFILGIITIPIFWTILFTLNNDYKKVLNRYRIQDLKKTFLSGLFGSIIIFFSLFIDDFISQKNDYYKLLIVYFIVQFTIILIIRLNITYSLIKKVRHRDIKFNTIIFTNEEIKDPIDYKYNCIVNINSDNKNEIINSIKEIKNKYISDALIYTTDKTSDYLQLILAICSISNVSLKMTNANPKINFGLQNTNNIYGKEYLEIKLDISNWQKLIKRIFDILFSIFAISLLLPVYIIVAITIKLTSKGPVFYRQKRIGIKGIPFDIIKFRTMKVDAEKGGPKLSSSNDARITKVGKILRKYRIDEFPQFFNVLFNDMSIVGPRPERQFFIDQISKKSPEYIWVQKVKPGITSWGQVKFGYAENVDEMLQRLKFDIHYMYNRDFTMDLKILLYTILTVIKAEGK